MISGIQSSTFYWVLTGIFAALHLVMTMLPLFVLAGGSGFISIGLATAVIIGFLLGPFYGALSVLMGSVLGVLIFNIGGFLGPIIPVVAPVTGAFVAGCLRTKRPQIVVLVFMVGLIAFLVSPIGLQAIVYLWMHIIAFSLVFLFIYPKTKRLLYERLEFNKTHLEKTILPVLLISFIALLSDSLIGGSSAAYWFIYGLSMSADTLALIYVGTAVLYPLERIAVTVVVTGVLLTLARTLTGTQFSSLINNTPKSINLDELHTDEAS